MPYTGKTRPITNKGFTIYKLIKKQNKIFADEQMFKISKARASDSNQVKRIEVESNLSPWTERDYILETNREDSLFLVANDSERVIGFILARLIMPAVADQKYIEFEIYNIAVQSDYRRKHIGSLLLEELFQIAAEKRVRRIILEVRSSNQEAQNFYTKHGFEINGLRKNFYTNPPEDALLMCRSMPYIQNR